jgi:hypothetical protein
VNLDFSHTRHRGNLGLLTPGALQRHPIPVSVFCFGAVIHHGLALSQPLARLVSFEAGRPEVETAISDIDGAENRTTDKTMTTRTL